MQIVQSLKTCMNAIKNGQLKTFIPLLSIFTMKGAPLTLDLHYQFAPLFNVVYPRQQTIMSGRQVGKTWQLATSSVIRGAFIPFYDILHIQPRDEQRTRYHTTILKPLIESSPLNSALIKKTQLSKVLLKQFKSKSFLYLGTAYASAGALRGLSGCAQVIVDQEADIQYEFVPIIKEVMSANINHGYTIFAGTPTTTDTTCGIIWSQSSQAEWIIKCTHCNYFNIPNPEQDLQKMIGDKGLICAKCGRQVSPINGGYVHAIPERQFSFPGYHISQPIHPLHLLKDPNTGQPKKWYDLLDKIHRYSKLTLYNEVYGWPYDQSINPLTLKDLVNAQHDIKIETIQDIARIRHNYRCLALSVDWDGGGALSESYTVAAVVGLRNDSNRLDVLYGKRWPKQSKPHQQAQQLMQWIDIIRPDIFPHDNTGAGFLRMQILKQKGLLFTSTYPVPFTYTGPKKGDVITFDKAQQQPDYVNYTIDKSRSLAIVIQAIKDGSLRIPKFNVQDPSGITFDFMALKEDPRQLAGARTVVLIGKKNKVPDDWAHAVNFGASAIWYKFHIYPVLGQKYDVSVLQDEYDNFSPRSEFQQFANAIAARAAVIQPDFQEY